MVDTVYVHAAASPQRALDTLRAIECHEPPGSWVMVTDAASGIDPMLSGQVLVVADDDRCDGSEASRQFWILRQWLAGGGDARQVILLGASMAILGSLGQHMLTVAGFDRGDIGVAGVCAGQATYNKWNEEVTRLYHAGYAPPRGELPGWQLSPELLFLSGPLLREMGQRREWDAVTEQPGEPGIWWTQVAAAIGLHTVALGWLVKPLPPILVWPGFPIVPAHMLSSRFLAVSLRDAMGYGEDDLRVILAQSRGESTREIGANAPQILQ